MPLAEILGLLFDPPRRLFSMATAFWVSQTLFAAAELEVFTLLEPSPLTLEEFCRAKKLQTRTASALLGSLVSLGLLRFRRGRYLNAPIASRWLVKGMPEYMGDGLIMLNKRLYGPWGKLTEALVNDRPTTFDPVRGELFDYLDEHVGEQELLARAHHALSLIPARELARRFNFSNYRHLADLGGGTGVYSIEIARRHPRLRATVVERKRVCSIAAAYIQREGLQERVKAAPGDIFRDPMPEGSDVALLSHVAHDYSPEENASLFSHVFKQLPPRGALLLSEWLWDRDRTAPLASSLMSLTMIIDTRRGRTYTFRELDDLLHGAGFEKVRREPLYAAAQLVIAHKNY